MCTVDSEERLQLYKLYKFSKLYKLVKYSMDATIEAIRDDIINSWYNEKHISMLCLELSSWCFKILS